MPATPLTRRASWSVRDRRPRRAGAPTPGRARPARDSSLPTARATAQRPGNARISSRARIVYRLARRARRRPAKLQRSEKTANAEERDLGEPPGRAVSATSARARLSASARRSSILPPRAPRCIERAARIRGARRGPARERRRRRAGAQNHCAGSARPRAAPSIPPARAFSRLAASNGSIVRVGATPAATAKRSRSPAGIGGA